MHAQQFLTELRQRGVYRVAAIYSAGAWALLQVADILFPLLQLPYLTVTMVLTAAAAGFPVALVLAWFFDLTPQGVVEAPPIVSSPGRALLSPYRIAEFALFLALILLVGYLYVGRLALEGKQASPPVVSAANTRASIAVIPFVNMSGAQEMDYFGDGLAEEILNLLAKLNELNVAARTSSFYFKGKDVDIQDIAEHLGVKHVLEGSVRHQGNRVRVTAQLIDASNGFHLWSETYDRAVEDIFSLQDDIATKVVDSLQIILSTASRSVLQRTTKVNPLAYDYYLKGRAMLRRALQAQSLDTAVEMFTRAVELDPAYAEAYAGLCDSKLGIYDESLASEDFEGAEKACHRALTLDTQAIAVYIALGNLYRSSGQYTLAVQDFDKAISLNAMAVDAYDGLAQTYVLQNKIDLAEKNFRRAIDLQPNYWRGYMSFGNYLFEAGRVEEAISQYKRIITLMPDSERALTNLGAAYYMLGQFERAADSWQQATELRPTAEAYSNLGSSLYFLGRFDEAVQMYHRAVELTPENAEWWGNLGDAYRYSTLGEELALPMYERALQLARERLKINPSDSLSLTLVGYYYANLGERKKALDYINQGMKLAPRDMYVFYTATTALCALGDLQQAMVLLDKAVELGYPARLLAVDAGLKELEKMPQFGALQKRGR